MLMTLLCVLPGLAAETEQGCAYEIDMLLWQMDEPGLDENLPLGSTYERYYLTLDGRLLVAAERWEDLSALVRQAAEQYVDEDTISCALVDEGRVKLCHGTVSISSPRDLNEAWKSLQDVLQFDTVDSETTEKVLPFERETIYDETVYADEPAVTTPGEDGVLEIVTRSSFRNGELQDLTVESNVVKEPVAEITTIGTKEHPEYVWPATGRLSSRFGSRNIIGGSRNHKGIDIAVPKGTTVGAAKAGKVTFAGWCGGYGYLVKLEHEDGDVTYYGHNSTLLVKEGDQVEQGGAIALSGSTGRSTGPHIHFEIRINGTAVDPLPYLNQD